MKRLYFFHAHAHDIGKLLLLSSLAMLLGCKPSPENQVSDVSADSVAIEGVAEPMINDTGDGSTGDYPNPVEATVSEADQKHTSNVETSTVVNTNNLESSPHQAVIDTEFLGVDNSASEGVDSAEPFCLTDIANTEAFDNTDACERISKRLASVSFKGCSTANLLPTGCESVNGFPILLSEFGPVVDRQPQGKVLLIGGTHGDELTSVSVTFRWIQKLKQHHTGLFHWHVVPMMNPDGVLKREASRTNINGVDLNRNMPSNDWMATALKYWEGRGRKDPRKYPGQAAASEPETQWLIDEINRFKPDAIIAVHAPYGVVDFDSLALKAAPKSLGKLHLNLLGTYPGSLGNYAGINRNIPVITLELPHSWEMPSETETTKIWEDIVRWLKKNVNNPEDRAIGE